MSFKYKRILVKLSGEMLAGSDEFGIDRQTIHIIAQQLIKIAQQSVEVVVVVGGGNIFRGVKALSEGIERLSGDYMGMLATVINGIAMKSVIETQGYLACVYSSVAMHPFCERFIVTEAQKNLRSGSIIICVAGTGNPYFTTDTAAVLRAIELKCEVVLKATKVDGVYDCDPNIHPHAKRYDHISYEDVLLKKLHVMDMAAIALASENNMPLIVFSLEQADNLMRVLQGQQKHTLIKTSKS